jgi:hypothetical protein
MSQAQIETIIERWMSDAEFRARMQTAPQATLAEEGYELSDEEMQALEKLDLTAGDEELLRQASFGG